MTDDQETAPQNPPVLRVVRGDPTPEELAAVVAVVTAAGTVRAGATGAPRGQWRSRGRNVRPSLAHGPDAWRASGLPR